MYPDFLVPEVVSRENSSGPVMDIGDGGGKILTFTLGVNRIVEQQSLEVSIWGSADGSAWGLRPLLTFPQKFYCGTYQLDLDLTRHPEVHYLRAEWKMNRWGRGEMRPLFGFYLAVQESKAESEVALLATS